MKSSWMSTGAVSLIAAAASLAHGDIVMGENFESGLGNWTGKNGRGHHGLLVADPFDSSNTVLSFNKRIAGGDMFSAIPLTFETDQRYRVSFDYLGLGGEGSRPGDTGGYVGFSVGTPSRHRWLWATGSASRAEDVLIDDGQWHSYDFDFSTADIGLGNELRLMVEDFSGSGGTSGDAYFDNFAIAAVPSPGPLALLGLGGVLATSRRRR